jgi:Putative addiction module component
MEVIWDDLKERFDQSEVSPQVKQLLDERRAKVERGEARMLDWDSVKAGIGRA